MVPDITPLLQAAQARGAGIVRGREMLSQCVESMAAFLVWPLTNRLQAASGPNNRLQLDALTASAPLRLSGAAEAQRSAPKAQREKQTEHGR